MSFILPMTQLSNITEILQNWSEGDRNSLDALIPLVYEELQRLAHRALIKNSGDGNFQTTALVNEAYLRLVDVRKVDWRNRVHFFAVSANLMRNILVDFARQRLSQKRGGEKTRVELDDALDFSPRKSDDLIRLDEALNELAKLSERQSRVVELKFFGGLTEDEIGEVLKISPATVRRDWSVARAWLYRELAR
ncbi:MAG: sigma-70 family RNA polymerase sigma factor [Pyrinomonadaceae bacterium]